MDIPQSFLLCDAILRLFANITSEMVVYPKQIERHLREELPFMATEKLLMKAVEKGQSRQEMHELIKNHSLAAGVMVKEHGNENDLLMRLAGDPSIPFSIQEIQDIVGDFSQFTGRAAAQTDEYLNEVVYPLLGRNSEDLSEIDSSLAV